MFEELPYVPALTPVVGSLAELKVPYIILVAFMFSNPEPSPMCSPSNFVAVIVFAVNDPEASLETIVEAPFADAAVVLAFAKVPVVIFEAFVVSVVADVAKPETLAAARENPTFATEVTLPYVSTTICGTRDELPYVPALTPDVGNLALLIVPEVKFEALMFCNKPPSPIKDPDTVVAVIVFAANDPEASLETIVEAPFEDDEIIVAEFSSPVTAEYDICIATFDADVILPYVSVTICALYDELPYDPAVTPDGGNLASLIVPDVKFEAFRFPIKLFA